MRLRTKRSIGIPQEAAPLLTILLLLGLLGLLLLKGATMRSWYDRCCC